MQTNVNVLVIDDGSIVIIIPTTRRKKNRLFSMIQHWFATEFISPAWICRYWL